MLSLLGIAIVIAAIAATIGLLERRGMPEAERRPPRPIPAEPVPPASPDPPEETPEETLFPTPAPDARSGLHFTPEELAIWRERAERGPYKSEGDVSPNSPGDWDRIVEEARAFLRNPDQAVWDGPTVLDSDGCVKHVPGPNDNNNPPRPAPARLRDAAFYYLIIGDIDFHDTVRARLLEQARMPRLDFSDRRRWCEWPSMGDGSPTFDIANWLTQLLYAYDYLGPDSFTAAERAELNDWFYEAATFFAEYSDADLDRLFVDRPNADYTLSEDGERTDNPRVGYYGSTPTYLLHRSYNNRKASRYRFVAAAAVKLAHEDYVPDDAGSKLSVPELRESAKLFVKEWLTYSVFPEGFFGEFERWTASRPNTGLKYAGEVLGPIATIADVLARDGDFELLDFSTADGARGTESSFPKTLHFAVQTLGRYIDGSYERYATNDDSRNGDPEYLINGSDGRWHVLFDMHVAPLNRYYRDPYITGIYTRAGPGLDGYPPNPANSHFTVWRGDWGTLPGLLFMYGLMEDFYDYSDVPMAAALTNSAQGVQP